MLNPLPMILLFVIDLIIAFVCSLIYTVFYHKLYVPKDMVMIFGNEKAVDLKFKMDERSDKYRITKVLPYTDGKEILRNEIDKHDAVIINDVPSQVRNDILKYCYTHSIRTYVVPKISDIISRGADEITLFDTPLLLVKGQGLNPAQKFIKRIMDLVLCSIAMIPAGPIMLIVAICIRAEDHGPVFYKQARMTEEGKVFNILKFRSMIVDAEKGGYNLEMRATGKDPRITKVGNIIRSCRIDELPQILNIFKGDMAEYGIIGYRLQGILRLVIDALQCLTQTYIAEQFVTVVRSIRTVVRHLKEKEKGPVLATCP